MSLVHGDVRVQEDQGLEEKAARVGEEADSGAQMVDLGYLSDGVIRILGRALLNFGLIHVKIFNNKIICRFKKIYILLAEFQLSS